ncbi:MAG TPA: response regulator [Planctomycetota bacterium]|nr:response regulator [Planctomycetota bacterium]
MIEHPMHVLFGESDPERSTVIREHLRRRGIGVAASSASRDLMTLARRQCPDVIVLDEGLEVAGEPMLVDLLRNQCPQARIILLLPPGSHPDRENQRHLEPVCSLVAPVSEDILETVITSALWRPDSDSPSARPSVILCVDDDVLFLNSLMRILRSHGYAVIGYDDPEKALEAIPLHHPSMIFLDVRMPGMNGLDLASELRTEYGASLPLVLLSGNASDQEIADGYKTGARYYLTKPCDPGQVLEIAEVLVGKVGPQEREGSGTQLEERGRTR